MIKVLHITNDYAGSTVYKKLFKELDSLNVEQVVYTPVRDANLIGKNALKFNIKSSRIIYSDILNRHIDKVFYPYKIFKVYKDLEEKIKFSEIDLIHAHTWYSDGGVAYFLAKKYDIPYIITIRNTDLNVFQKKLVYLRPFGRRVLEKTKNIVLISASYLPRIVSLHSLNDSLSSIKSKIKILPNGVDSYWLHNTVEFQVRTKSKDPIKLIYVGRFTAGKNVPLVQHAVLRLNKQLGYHVHLDIVGGGGADDREVRALTCKYKKYFTFHGKVFDKNKLSNLYRSADIFVMPSSHETFGLVYVEAMLQGLPILYTANEGIDGFYSEDIGEKVQTPCVQEIAQKLIVMIENLNRYSIPLDELKKNHDWTEIAKQYLSIYKENL